MNTHADKPEPEAAHERFCHDAMACTFELILVGHAARRRAQAAAAAFAELDRLEQLLSRFIPHSEIAQLNAAAPGRFVRVSPETVACLQLADRLQRETEGSFDIAFGSAGLRGERGPLLAFDPAGHAVSVMRAGVVLDVGGIGKGFALDRVVALLREWGITGGLAHGGQSTVAAFGRAAHGRAWRVALRDPERPDHVLGTLQLTDAALSGSGQLLHRGHIIDPRTGQPAEARGNAWAVAPSAALADGLSTAFVVMADDAIERFCRRVAGVTAILRAADSSAGALRTFGAPVPLVDAGDANPATEP